MAKSYNAILLLVIDPIYYGILSFLQISKSVSNLILCINTGCLYIFIVGSKGMCVNTFQ